MIKFQFRFLHSQSSNTSTLATFSKCQKSSKYFDSRQDEYFSRRNELLSQGGNPAPDCPGPVFIAWAGPGLTWAGPCSGLYML